MTKFVVPMPENLNELSPEDLRKLTTAWVEKLNQPTVPVEKAVEAQVAETTAQQQPTETTPTTTAPQTPTAEQPESSASPTP